MDRQTLINLAQRLAQAPDNDTRLLEVGNLAPDAMLSRIGLSHRSSFTSNAITVTGIFVVGAAIGAGVALLFAPTTGEELMAKLRKQGKRLSGEAKEASKQVGERIAELEGTAHAKPDGHAPTNHADAAHA